MIRLSLAAAFLSIQCACAIGVRVPEGWSHVDAPSDMPPSTRPVVRLLSPGKDQGVSICKMDAGISLDAAAKSYARWMPARGISIEAASPVSLGGLEARHITGHISYAGGGAVISDEVYLLSTPGGVLAVEMTGKDASSSINEILGWIDFQTATVPPER